MGDDFGSMVLPIMIGVAVGFAFAPAGATTIMGEAAAGSFAEVNGTLYDVRRMEVHENQAPIVGFKGHTAHRLVLKTQKPSSIILPEKLQKDY